MKIVVLDGYTENPGDLSWDELGRLGELTVYDRTPVQDKAEICRRIGNSEAVFTNKVPIDGEILEACPNIQYIGILATGYNIVDTKAAREHGIVVCNIPTYGTAAVGQFAIALLLEVCHHIGHHDQMVKQGRWTNSADWCFWDTPLIELQGKTMGIIGLGRIGMVTAKIASALGMHILAYSQNHNVEGASVAEYVELDTLLSRSDVISLHCPLTGETEGIINKESISKMKDGVILINNSRGPLVVEKDLADALNSGKVYAAALDVASKEPISDENPLLHAPNCIITPHISWAAKESRQRLMDIAVSNLCAFQSGKPENVVC